MKIVGLTGGIGAGKSWVAKIFKSLGVPVYDSDTRAKELYSESEELRALMISHFGPEVYQGNLINRKYLSQIVFNNAAELKMLNSLVHPLLQNDFDDWTQKQKSSYVLREAAILVESGGYEFCDEVIHVTAPMDVRITRVMQRDNVVEEVVKALSLIHISEPTRPY